MEGGLALNSSTATTCGRARESEGPHARDASEWRADEDPGEVGNRGWGGEGCGEDVPGHG